MSPSKKKFKIPRDQIKQLIPDMGACITSDQIMVDGLNIGYMCREEPQHDVDTGWRFFSGEESREYVNNPHNFGLYEVNTICNYDPAIIPYLESPAGSVFHRVPDSDKFEKEDLSSEE